MKPLLCNLAIVIVINLHVQLNHTIATGNLHYNNIMMCTFFYVKLLLKVIS